VRKALDAKARAAGYTDFAEMIAKTWGEPVKTLARRTGFAASTIKQHRRTSGL
jgi:hypothetical protein